MWKQEEKVRTRWGDRIRRIGKTIIEEIIYRIGDQESGNRKDSKKKLDKKMSKCKEQEFEKGEIGRTAIS